MKSRDQPVSASNLIDLRCPVCNKLEIMISSEDQGIHYMQTKCPRCKTTWYYSHGEIKIK